MCICFLHCLLWYWSRCRDEVWHKSVQKDIDGQQTEQLWQMTCPEQTIRGDFVQASAGAALLKAVWTSDPMRLPSTALPSAERRKHSLISISLTAPGLSLSTARLKPWDSPAWKLRAAEAQSRGTESPVRAETAPCRHLTRWGPIIQGFGCPAHVNTTSNLWAQSLGVIWKAQSGFWVFFLWFVYSPSRS